MLILDEKGYEYRKWKGGSSFPVGAGLADITKYRNNAFACHWHDGVELLYVTEGELMHIVNGKCYHMRKGDFMFVNAGSMHEGHATEAGIGKYMSISFLTSILSPDGQDKLSDKYFGDSVSGVNFPQLFLEAADPQAIKLIELCEEISALLHDRQPCHELYVKANLFKIWAILFGLTSKNECQQKPDISIHRIKKAVYYINENYCNKLDLEEISAYCNISKSEFCRSFKRVMRRTPFDYIMDLRIRKSIELLDDGKGVTESALSSGFFDSSYYTKMFKRYMGYTPREYVKRKNS